LNAALKEMYIEKGSMNVLGTIAYAAQQPWIFSSTIRQNIIFGKEFDKTKYKTVIETCALTTVGFTILCSHHYIVAIR